MKYLIEELLGALSHIIEDMDRAIFLHAHWLVAVHQDNRCGARNLLEYLAFRSQDRTELRESLQVWA